MYVGPLQSTGYEIICDSKLVGHLVPVMSFVNIQSKYMELQSRNERMKAFPTNCHEALASSFLKGLAWEMRHGSRSVASGAAPYLGGLGVTCVLGRQ